MDCPDCETRLAIVQGYEACPTCGHVADREPLVAP